MNMSGIRFVNVKGMYKVFKVSALLSFIFTNCCRMIFEECMMNAHFIEEVIRRWTTHVDRDEVRTVPCRLGRFCSKRRVNRKEADRKSTSSLSNIDLNVPLNARTVILQKNSHGLKGFLDKSA